MIRVPQGGKKQQVPRHPSPVPASAGSGDPPAELPLPRGIRVIRQGRRDRNRAAAPDPCCRPLVRPLRLAYDQAEPPRNLVFRWMRYTCLGGTRFMRGWGTWNTLPRPLR